MPASSVFHHTQDAEPASTTAFGHKTEIAACLRKALRLRSGETEIELMHRV